jgi:hypothetical protein
VGRVGGARGDPRGDRSGFGDALFENLAVLGFLVVQQRRHVDRLVQLADARVDPDRLEERLHAKGARLVRHDRHDELADLLVAQHLREHPDEDRGRGSLAPAGAGRELREQFVERRPEGGRDDDAARHEAAERRAPLLHVANLDALLVGPVERRVGDAVVGNRHAEPIAEHLQIRVIHLLLLVRDVLALTRFAQPIALHGPRQYDRRSALVLRGGAVGVVDLHGVVSAERHLLQIVVGQMTDHLEQPRVCPPEMFAQVRAVLDDVALVFAVDDLPHALDEEPLGVARDQVVPLGAPQDFDHVPAGAPEHRLELLDDLPVAAHRPVEPLQVAVDDEDQIVELLARGERERPECFGLVGLAVAQEGPDFLVGRRLEPAILEVAGKARLVDGHERAEPHRHGGELPVVGHQPRVRIGRESGLGAQLVTEIAEVRLVEPPLEKAARIDTGRGVSLVVDDVGLAPAVPAAEEVVEAYFVEGRRRRKRRDVAADPVRLAIAAHDHGQRVPPDEALDAALDLAVAGKRHLLGDRDRVDVGRAGGKRHLDARLPCPRGQRVEQADDPGFVSLTEHVVEGLNPFTGFDRLEGGRVGRGEVLHVYRRPWSSSILSILDPRRREDTGVTPICAK